MLENRESDADQYRALVRQRRLATTLLVLMALLFVVTRLVPEPPFWILLVRAASEAALVGGLADWFAVTALFRHPFGLPIPHTAIIPRNQERIGVGLGRFVERHFLEPHLLAHKLRSLDLAGRGARWLARPESASRLSERLTASVPFVVNAMSDRELREFVRRSLHEQVAEVDLAPVLGRLLDVVTAAGQHQALFDRALALGNELLLRHEERIYEVVSDKSRWWVPPSIDRHIARRIVTGLHELLEELAARDHAVRAGFDTAVQEFIDGLKHSPAFSRRVERYKRELLESPLVQGYLGAVWDELRARVLREAGADDSRLREALTAALVSLGNNLLGDDSVRARLNRRMERLVLEFAVPWRREIGDFIAEVVRGWDSATVTRRLELVVGRDLQYIRINGTLVGALVGVAIFLLSEFAFP